MLKLSKLNFIKLASAILLISASGFVYSDILFNLNDYKNDFDVWNNRRVEYLTGSTMTFDWASQVYLVDNELALEVRNNKNVPNQMATGRIESFKTTKSFLSDPHRGKVEVELYFTCYKNGAKRSGMNGCNHVWPAFWLWYMGLEDPKTKISETAEIDIAEFMVHNDDGTMSHSNHIYDGAIGENYYERNEVLTWNYPTPSPNNISKYAMTWECDEGYTWCKVRFFENDTKQNSTLTYTSDTKKGRRIIAGFKNGYHIVFTQQYFSTGGPKAFAGYYNDFRGTYSQVVIKSLSVTQQ